MRRLPCGFVVFAHFLVRVGRGGAGLITSCVLRSHTDAALLYALLQFHGCVMLPEHIFIWYGLGGVGWGKTDSEEVHNHKIVGLRVCTYVFLYFNRNVMLRYCNLPCHAYGFNMVSLRAVGQVRTVCLCLEKVWLFFICCFISTLHHVLLYLTYLTYMLCYIMFSCT